MQMGTLDGPAPRFERAFEGAFEGELSVGVDGAADGFCIDRGRPDLRCWVEILVEDRMAATVLARDPRTDLVARGHPDPAHGFCAVLPPAALPPWPELLVWARVRGARRGFAQRLLVRTGYGKPVPERERVLQAQVGALSQRLEALCRRTSMAPGLAWQERMQALASLLAGRAGRARPTPELPWVRHPATTLAVPCSGSLGDTLDRIDRLAPLARALAAELLILTWSAAPELALLPAMVPNLRVVQAVSDPARAAVEHARGARIVLLGSSEPSHVLLADALRSGGPPPAMPGVLAVLPGRPLR